MNAPGRFCPARYRYGAAALAAAPELRAQTLYVVGGLYGNLPALDTIEAMAAGEAGPVSLMVNGDFNWFDVAPGEFEALNRRVLAHAAIQGNVEAELGAAGSDAGCGCAYPQEVDDATVERSNLIHARLRETAAAFPAVTAALAALPMYAVVRIGAQRVGIVHGDADALAGWGFDRRALDDPQHGPWLAHCFRAAGVDFFASSHTCRPALRGFDIDGRRRAVINNGAAGMPNFRGERSGLISRIGLTPSPHAALYGMRAGDLFIDALGVAYDHTAWLPRFLAQWEPGSPAHASYYGRIVDGPRDTRAAAAPADRSHRRTEP
jgi:predicted small integral membrane protein